MNLFASLRPSEESMPRDYEQEQAHIHNQQCLVYLKNLSVWLQK